MDSYTSLDKERVLVAFKFRVVFAAKRTYYKLINLLVLRIMTKQTWPYISLAFTPHQTLLVLKCSVVSLVNTVITGVAWAG